jgi:isopentenyl-diphosphate delta-isomerase
MDREQVVLVDDAGRPVGVADKATVHGRCTPRHLAFSCYGFDVGGRVLVTGEDLADAVRRRLTTELGVRALDLRLVLPDFSYRAADAGGIEEHELCPVFVATLDGDPRPDPDEVADWEWWAWERFLDEARRGTLSPWAQLQAPLLAAAADPQTARAG